MCSAASLPNITYHASVWCCSRRKRVFDFVCASVLLVPALPLMAVAALLVRLSSSGPVLFRQRRMGARGREITMLKFRTMRHADAPAGPSVTRDGDPRITRIGTLLRRSKLDELPQLWNVVRGDMSLVGPRPDVGEFLAELPPELRELLRLRPGITGWATLSYPHEERILAAVPADDVKRYYTRVLLPEKARLDLEYSRRATFWSDLAVLIRTAAAILN